MEVIRGNCTEWMYDVLTVTVSRCVSLRRARSESDITLSLSASLTRLALWNSAHDASSFSLACISHATFEYLRVEEISAWGSLGLGV